MERLYLMYLNILFPLMFSISQFRNLIGFQQYRESRRGKKKDFWILYVVLSCPLLENMGHTNNSNFKQFLIDLFCKSTHKPYLLQTKLEVGEEKN